MRVFYCDGCKQEITSENKLPGGSFNTRGDSVARGAYTAQSGKILVWETTLSAGPQGQDWCKYCMIDALRAIDNRTHTPSQPLNPPVPLTLPVTPNP